MNRFVVGYAQKNGMVRRFAELSDDGEAWRKELRELRGKFPRRLYGGLTWPQLEKLLAQHRSAQTDLGIFLFAGAWHQAGRQAIRSPLLIRAAIELMGAAFKDPSLVRQLERAIKLAHADRHHLNRRAALGYTDWWKLNVLLFMLHHPRPAYPVRELRAHLRRHGMAVSAKYLQRFCAQYGIKRDMRAGRPRSRPTDAANETR